MDCGKHKHQGYKGVCASCLRERLSLLPNTTTYYTIDLSNSSTTTVSPSPVKEKYHRRSGSMTMSFAVREALSGNLIGAFGGGLKKSKSMAHVPKDTFIVRDSTKKKTTTRTTEKLKSTTAKVSGFWRKLFHLKGKGGGSDVGGGLVASRQRVY